MLADTHIIISANNSMVDVDSLRTISIVLVESVIFVSFFCFQYFRIRRKIIHFLLQMGRINNLTEWIVAFFLRYWLNGTTTKGRYKKWIEFENGVNSYFFWICPVPGRPA